MLNFPRKQHLMPKIKSVTIQNFKGIRELTSINFTVGGKSASAIFYGENGSGKSSIVDAVEFSLRSSNSKNIAGRKHQKREVRNLLAAKTEQPYLKFEMNDGNTYSRGRDRSSFKLRPSETVPGFEISPLAIRRKDIEIFWDSTDEERLDNFIDYFRIFNKRVVSQNTLDNNNKLLEDARREFNKSRQKLIKYIHADQIKYLPKREPNLDNFLNSKGFWKKVPSKSEGRELVRNYKKSIRNLQQSESLANTYAGFEVFKSNPKLLIHLKTIQDGINNSFREITGEQDVNFKIYVNKSTFSITVDYKGKFKLNPVDLFSESYRDLIAYLIYLNVHKATSKPGISEIIILDDVFQSVDNSLKIKVLDYTVNLLSKWQIFITVHDRLWEESCARVMAANNINVIRYTVKRNKLIDNSPQISTRKNNFIFDDLDAMLGTGVSSATIAAVCGRTLEEILNISSQHLNSKIARQVNDFYTLDPLAGSVFSTLKKCQNPELDKLIIEINKYIHLRNIGAHDNYMNKSLTEQECLELVKLTRQLYEKLFCSKCATPYRMDSTIKPPVLVKSCRH